MSVAVTKHNTSQRFSPFSDILELKRLIWLIEELKETGDNLQLQLSDASKHRNTSDCQDSSSTPHIINGLFGRWSWLRAIKPRLPPVILQPPPSQPAATAHCGAQQQGKYEDQANNLTQELNMHEFNNRVRLIQVCWMARRPLIWCHLFTLLLLTRPATAVNMRGWISDISVNSDVR